MLIAVATFGVAFAAFGIWLTVRIVNRRERWAKRTMVVLVLVLAAYPLSIGPVIWLAHNGLFPRWAARPLACLYFPLDSLETVPPLGRMLVWYMDAWTPIPKEPVIFDPILQPCVLRCTTGLRLVANIAIALLIAFRFSVFRSNPSSSRNEQT